MKEGYAMKKILAGLMMFLLGFTLTPQELDIRLDNLQAQITVKVGAAIIIEKAS